MSLPLRPLSSLWLLASCALLVARSAAGDAHNATAVPVIAEPSPRVTTWRDHIPADWTTDDVFRFLESLDLAKHRDLFDSEEVDGRALLALTHDSPVVLEMLPAGDRATLLEAVGRLDRSPSTLRLPQGATVATWAARRPRNWTRDDVLRWCDYHGIARAPFEANDQRPIDGAALFALTKDTLLRWGLSAEDVGRFRRAMEVVEAKERLFEAQARIDGLNLRVVGRYLFFAGLGVVLLLVLLSILDRTDVVFGKASYAFGVAVCAVLAYAIPYLFRT